MNIDLTEIVRKFVEKCSRYSGHSESTVANLFIPRKSLKPLELFNPYAFLAMVSQHSYPDNQRNDLEKNLSHAIPESIKAYNQSKETAIKLYKLFVAFLKEQYDLNIIVEFPPIAIWANLDRQLYIAKLLQNRNLNTSELSDILLVSERTIEKDLAKLRGRDNDPLQVMGQKLIVNFDRDRNGIRFPSTVHPLFLTLNLTQVIALLQGLELQSRIPGYADYAFYAAKNIWIQLSDYAKNRLFSLADKLELNKEWLHRLDNEPITDENGRLFSNERQCSNNEGCGNILMCLKNSQCCHLEYYEGNGTSNFYYDVLPINYYEHRVLCEVDGTQFWFDLRRILRSAVNIEELA